MFTTTLMEPSSGHTLSASPGRDSQTSLPRIMLNGSMLQGEIYEFPPEELLYFANALVSLASSMIQTQERRKI